MARRTRKGRRPGRYGLKQNTEDINPMHSLTNLADAMLVLAMGIMVALVLHWNVNLAESSGSTDTEDSEQVVPFHQEDMEDQEKLPDSAKPSGQVYYDAESDTYYIVDGDGQNSAGEQ